MRGCCHGNGKLGVKSTGQFEQVRCITRRQEADAESRVVAGAFAFGPKACCRHPAERMKPVEGRRDMNCQKNRRITPANVRGFVSDHSSAAREGPSLCN